nr:hypothetical protein B0A51_07203 [Rachicladosporium sp. CCFEE 5018]
MTTTCAAVSESPLLRLSGELRNVLWRLVVIQEDHVPYTNTGVEEPGLLLVCHATRSEAASIFYLENKILAHVPSYDPTSLVLLKQRFLALDLTTADHSCIELSIGGAADWSNLQKWLKLIFTNALRRKPTYDSQTTVQESIIVGMFRMVTAMRGQEMSWKLVASLLEDQRRTLALLRPGWELKSATHE